MVENKEISCIEFLTALYSKCEPAYINLRFLPSKVNQFISTSEIDLIPTITEGVPDENCYFGVATREDGNGTKKGIKEIPALWVDIDFKDVPEIDAREQINNFQPQPTYVSNSGGGLHLYWLLKHPADPDSIAKVEDLLDRLAKHFRGDPNATDASRILRIPGTNNLKYDPIRRIYVTARSDTECDLEDFEYLPKCDTCDTGDTEQRDYEKESEKKIKRLMTCKFLQHCDDDSIQLSEPEWYAMVSILSHSKVPGHIDLIHGISRRYPGYSKRETDEKILHASNASGPMTCKKIKEIWDCGDDCFVTSPVGLERMSSLDEPEEEQTQSENKQEEQTQENKRKSGFKLHRIKGCDVSFQPYVPITEGFPLFKGLLYQVAADSGEFKTMLSLHICKCIVSGEYLFGKYKVLKKVPVLYFNEENPPPVMEERLNGFGLKNPDYPFYLYHFDGIRFDDNKWVDEVIREVEEVKTIENTDFVFVILDSLMDFHSQDENSSNEMKQVMSQIRRVVNAGSTVWSQHHVAKASLNSRGSGAIKGSLDMEFKVASNLEGELTLSITKNRVAPFESIVVVPRFEGAIDWTMEYKQTKEQDLWDKVSDVLTSEPASLNWIMEELEKQKVETHEKAVRRVLLDQVKKQLIKCEKMKVDITIVEKKTGQTRIRKQWVWVRMTLVDTKVGLKF